MFHLVEAENLENGMVIHIMFCEFKICGMISLLINLFVVEMLIATTKNVLAGRRWQEG